MSIRILYVDDEEYLLELGKEFLEEFGGIAVSTASSVKEALLMLSSEPYDGVVSDYQMPVQDGLELLAEVRRKYGEMPFILFTGRGRESVVIKALELGANFYLQKGGDPISQFTELFHKIRTAVEKHRMQKTIAQNEALMAEAERLAEMGSWSYDFGTDIITLSPQMRSILGLPAVGDVSLEEVLVIIGIDARKGLKASIQAAEEDGGAGFAYEFSIATQQGDARHYKANILISYTSDGKARTLTGVGQDISWLMKAKEQLEENARLNTLLNTIDDVVIVTDTSGKVLRVNRICIELLGGGEDILSGRMINDLISGEDGSPLSFIDAAFGPQQGNATRMLLRSPKGEMVHAEVRSSIGRWDGREVFVLVARDIGETIRAELALKESGANFRAFFETMTDLIVVGSPNGHILYFNEAVAEKLGYSAAELGEMHVLDMHPEEKRSEAENIFAAMFRGERDSCPLPLARKDGTYIPVETRAWFGRWNGKDCIFGISKDLTAEQEAQQRFERLFRSNPAPMALSTLPEQRFYDVNDAFLKAFGYSRIDVIGKTSTELDLFVHPEQHKAVGGELRHREHVADKELQARRKNGELIDGLFSGEVINSQGSQYLLTVMVDITERKRNEEELLRLTDRLSLATRAGGVGVWDFDVVNNKLTWDDQMFNLYGIREEEFSGAYEAWKAGLHPEDLKRGDEEIQMALRAEKEFDTEFRVLWPDGSVHQIRAIALVQRDATGRPLRMVGTNWDVTERKRAEEAVEHQSALLNSLLDSIPDIIFFKDIDGVYLGCNPAFAEFVGLPQDRIVGRTDHDLFNKEIADFFREQDERMLEHLQPRHNDEWITYPDGRRRLIDTLKTPYLGPDGELIGILGISRDITEHRNSEEALRDNEEKFRRIFEEMDQGIALTDEKGMIANWNHQMEKIFGTEAIEVIGKPSWTVMSALLRNMGEESVSDEGIEQMIVKMLETGIIERPEEMNRRIEFTNASGQRKIIRTSAFTIKVADSWLVGVTARKYWLTTNTDP